MFFTLYVQYNVRVLNDNLLHFIHTRAHLYIYICDINKLVICSLLGSLLNPALNLLCINFLILYSFYFERFLRILNTTTTRTTVEKRQRSESEITVNSTKNRVFPNRKSNLIRRQRSNPMSVAGRPECVERGARGMAAECYAKVSRRCRVGDGAACTGRRQMASTLYFSH